MLRLAFRAMNCQMLAALATDSASDSDPLAQVPGWFAGWEQTLSRFRPDSELSQLNRRRNGTVVVSDTLGEVLRAALRAAKTSDGLVVPTVLQALENAGYDRSFEQIANDENPLPPREASKPGDWRRIEWAARTRTVRLPEGLQLDLGGVAKGWAADKAARRLGRLGPALVDAGGDIAVTAPPADQPGWPIGIANPLGTGESLGTLCLARGGVATSGRDYRRWQRAGRWQHHLIDPRTGRPAETEVLSVTVIAPSARQAEIAAKAALLLGPEAGRQWIDARPELAALLVLENGAVLHSHRLPAYYWR